MKLLIVVIAIIIAAPLFFHNGASLAAGCAAGGNTPQGQILSGAAAAGNCNATSINTLIKDVINILSIIVGIAAVIMIILGGFKYITSAGDAGKVASGKNTLIYALVGLFIAALAQFIVHYVFSKAVGA
jgi:hypothetical protein